jgi:hypothetical protein
MGLNRTQKPRLTVLVRTSSNLANWPTDRPTDRPTKLPSWVSCERVASWQWREHGSRGIFTVRSRYQVMPSGDIEDFMCVAITEISVCLWLYSPLLDLGLFSSSLIFYTVSRTPWVGYQPVARLLPAQRTAQTQNKHTDISALSGFRTHDLSVWAGEDSSCLRSLGYYDWLQRSLSV